MKAVINIVGNLLMGYTFQDDRGKYVKFDSLSHEDQIKVVNSYAKAYKFWKGFLKAKERK